MVKWIASLRLKKKHKICIKPNSTTTSPYGYKSSELFLKVPQILFWTLSEFPKSYRTSIPSVSCFAKMLFINNEIKSYSCFPPLIQLMILFVSSIHF